MRALINEKQEVHTFDKKIVVENSFLFYFHSGNNSSKKCFIEFFHGKKVLIKDAS
jgi:hypothetical protein